jgi:hypothetical protein
MHSFMGSAEDITTVRIAYAKEAEPVGRGILPTGWKETVQTAVSSYGVR